MLTILKSLMVLEIEKENPQTRSAFRILKRLASKKPVVAGTKEVSPKDWYKEYVDVHTNSE